MYKIRFSGGVFFENVIRPYFDLESLFIRCISALQLPLLGRLTFFAVSDFHPFPV